MKKNVLLLVLLIIISCSKKQPDLLVKVNIKGLKKGTAYLKKSKDSSLITIDSFNINGHSKFELRSDLNSPEVFYLYLDKHSTENDRIIFFADKGTTEINTTLKNFVLDAKITGSKQQRLLEEYQSIISKSNNENLDLIKASFEARRDGDSTKLITIQKEYNLSLKNKYLYTVNFALNNKDSEIAPYLALSEIYNAKLTFLDTINKVLSPKVKSSKYGNKLQTYINDIRASESL